MSCVTCNFKCGAMLDGAKARCFCDRACAFFTTTFPDAFPVGYNMKEANQEMDLLLSTTLRERLGGDYTKRSPLDLVLASLNFFKEFIGSLSAVRAVRTVHAILKFKTAFPSVSRNQGSYPCSLEILERMASAWDLSVFEKLPAFIGRRLAALHVGALTGRKDRMCNRVLLALADKPNVDSLYRAHLVELELDEFWFNRAEKMRAARAYCKAIRLRENPELFASTLREAVAKNDMSGFYYHPHLAELEAPQKRLKPN